VDGVVAGSASGSGQLPLGTFYWHFGVYQGTASSGWPVTSTEYAPVSISNAAVYNSVLSATQVATHYQAMINSGVTTYNTVVTGDSPTSFWKLNETSGSTAADSVGSNPGTYNGGFTLNQPRASYSAAGTPACAWTTTPYTVAQTAIARGMIPLTNGSISATPGGGSGGAGGGGGHGGGGCFSPNTRVQTQRGDVRFDELTTDDSVLTAAGTWRRIYEILIHDWTDDMLDMGGAELVTYRHCFIEEDNWTAACNIYAGSQPYNGRVFNLKVATPEPDEVSASIYTEHSYTLANGRVVHNASTK
jgi:hypothetical protein